MDNHASEEQDKLPFRSDPCRACEYHQGTPLHETRTPWKQAPLSLRRPYPRSGLDLGQAQGRSRVDIRSPAYPSP